MRIAIVLGPFLPVPPLLGGAVERSSLLVAAAWRAAGHDVTVISRRFAGLPDNETRDGVRHRRVASFGRSPWLLFNLLRDFVYALRAARALPTVDVTVSNSFFLPLVLPRQRAGRIYVQVGRRPRGQMFLYSRADRLQAVSRAVAEDIAHQAPWLASRVATIGYAIPEAFFASGPAATRAKTVLFVGRLAPEKGIELLLAAFAAVLREHPSIAAGWTLRIVGPHAIAEGAAGDAYRRGLEALARPLGARCAFVGPVFDPDRLIGEYRQAAIFVYPTLARSGEALGLAPLEAMAAGCAVVVSGLRCFEDFLQDDKTGLRFAHDGTDPVASLAAQLTRLIADPALLARLAEAGHRAAQRFRAAAVAARMLDDFAALCATEANASADSATKPLETGR